VTGTSTGIGKTGVGLALCSLLLSQKLKVAYYKPLQSGSYAIPGAVDGGDGEWIQAQLSPNFDVHYSYIFKDPVSPHLASERENIPIEADKIKSDYQSHLAAYDFVVMEGSGGIAVPLDYSGTTIMDVLDFKSFPSILVVSPLLGTLNHTVLTYHFMDKKGSAPGGFVMAHVSEGLLDIVDNNIQTIKEITGMKYFGNVKFTPELNSKGSLDKATQEDLVSGLNEDFTQWLFT